MVSMARLHMDRDELEDARHMCTQLVKFDLKVETATMMLADIMFRSNEFDEAVGYFSRMLDTKNVNYKALEKLIHLIRRAGRLSEVLRFINKAEKSSARAAMEPGLHYCKGLLARFNRNNQDAITELNQARKDGEWGNKACCQMIEIYLDPDQLGDAANAPSPMNDKVHALNTQTIPNPGRSTTQTVPLNDWPCTLKIFRESSILRVTFKAIDYKP